MDRPVDGALEADLRRLYDQAGRAALVKCLNLVGRTEIAEEIVQKTFCRMWEKGLCFPSERAAFAWVYKVCHGLSVDYLRSMGSHHRSMDLDETQFVTPVPSPERIFSSRQELACALSELSEREAQVVSLVFWESLMQDEVAELLGVSRKTVVRDLHSALKKIGRKKQDGKCVHVRKIALSQT